ncbi:MAG: hypothetical protein IIU65_04295, partial [Clostridia bacterium]|nr:hypothetical protein [Clostridia bacterium]
MAPVVRFYLNDESYKELENSAKENNLTIQDYVRMKCISPRENELTLDQVIKQIEDKKLLQALFNEWTSLIAQMARRNWSEV